MTSPMVSVKDGAYEAIMMVLGDEVNPGDVKTIMTADLFDHDPMAVSVAYGTSVEGAAASASASGEMVTITAVDDGEAKVTVTATATPNASSFIPAQTVSNVAQITFPVMVVNADPVGDGDGRSDGDHGGRYLDDHRDGEPDGRCERR